MKLKWQVKVWVGECVGDFQQVTKQNASRLNKMGTAYAKQD